MGALAHAVRSGKALYVGLSNYPPAETSEAAKLLRAMGTPCLIHQPRYSMLDRWVEPELLATLAREQLGAVVFSPLAKGLLTNRYFDGIPADSRAGTTRGFSVPQTSPTMSWPSPSDSMRSRNRGDRRWRSWHWRGSCAIRSSPAPSSGPAG